MDKIYLWHLIIRYKRFYQWITARLIFQHVEISRLICKETSLDEDRKL